MSQDVDRSMQFEISPRTVLTVLVTAICFLLAAHVMGVLSTRLFGHDYVFGLVPLFDFGRERNIPTAFSAFQLFLAAAILAAISVSEKSKSEDDTYWFYWLGLAMIFVFLAYDELFQVHESFTVDLRERFSLGGLLYFSWIIPYGIGTIVIGLLFFRFLVSLPGRSARLFIVSGVIYMTGTVGLEMLGGLICSSGNCMSVAYTLVTTVEELFELFGIAIFIYALLSYTAANKCCFQVVIR